MDKVEFISAQHVKIEFEMASVLQRGLAYVLDTAIGYVYLIIVIHKLLIKNIKVIVLDVLYTNSLMLKYLEIIKLKNFL